MMNKARPPTADAWELLTDLALWKELWEPCKGYLILVRHCDFLKLTSSQKLLWSSPYMIQSTTSVQKERRSAKSSRLPSSNGTRLVCRSLPWSPFASLSWQVVSACQLPPEMVTLSNLGLEPPLRDLEFAHLFELGFRRTKKPSEQESWQDGRTNLVSQTAPYSETQWERMSRKYLFKAIQKGRFVVNPSTPLPTNIILLVGTYSTSSSRNSWRSLILLTAIKGPRCPRTWSIVHGHWRLHK